MHTLPFTPLPPHPRRIRRFMMLTFDSVHYRPGGVGHKRCRDEFEMYMRLGSDAFDAPLEVATTGLYCFFGR